MIIELYKFDLAGQIYAYTTAIEAVTYNAQEYDPAYVRRDAIKGTEQIARSGIKVKMARDASIVARYIGGSPTHPVELEIYQQSGVTTTLIWLGRVMTVSFAGSEAVLNCEPIFSSLKRNGLRALYQRNCRHALYDHKCTLNKDLFRVDGVLTGATSTTLTATQYGTKPNGWFVAGYVEYGTTPERRSITAHTGNTITLDAPLTGPEAGDTVKAFGGCDHLFTTCDAKFSNTDNFGGFPHIPKINPFGDTPVF